MVLCQKQTKKNSRLSKVKSYGDLRIEGVFRIIMRKKALFLLAFLFSAGILFAQADTTQTADPEIEMFVSTWSTDGAQAEIQFIDGFFQVHIETFDHGYDRNEWTYLCTYDADQQSLIAASTGTKHAYVYDFDTDRETKNTIYQDGSAVFTLQPDGYLMWHDEKEDAGRELLFTKLGSYHGIWQCDNITIQFRVTGGAYRCTISKNEGNNIIATWSYHCKYDLDSGNVISDDLGRKEIFVGCDAEGEIFDTVYNDGSAIFSINDDGCLLWNDLKENAGIGMLFFPNAFE